MSRTSFVSSITQFTSDDILKFDYFSIDISATRYLTMQHATITHAQNTEVTERALLDFLKKANRGLHGMDWKSSQCCKLLRCL